MESKNFKKELREARDEAIALQETMTELIRLKKELFALSADDEKLKVYIVKTADEQR